MFTFLTTECTPTCTPLPSVPLFAPQTSITSPLHLTRHQQQAYRKPSKPHHFFVQIQPNNDTRNHVSSNYIPSPHREYPPLCQIKRPLRTISSAREIENKEERYVYRVFAEIFLKHEYGADEEEAESLDWWCWGDGGESAGGD
jgi:hypothetical protein